MGSNPTESRLRTFNPEKLTEAIKARGKTKKELAESLNISRQWLSQIERGEKTPSVEVLWEISRKLDFPIHFFCMPSEEDTCILSYRHFRGAAKTSQRSRDMCDEKSKWVAKRYFELAEFIDLPKVNLPIFKEPFSPLEERSHFIETMAAECRRLWGLGNGPIGNLIGLMEKNGIFVSRTYFNDSKIDAFSYWIDDYRPIVILGNDKSSAVRSRFDAAHELGHLILHRYIDDSYLQKYHNEIESEAHRFASSFLLPRDTFPNEIFTPMLSNFVELKQRWKVSIAAMIYRCDDLNIFNKERILALRKHMSAKGYNRHEPYDDIIPFEQPVLPRKSLELILENGFKTIDDLEMQTGLHLVEIEKLLCLPENYFVQKQEASNVVKLNIRKF